MKVYISLCSPGGTCKPFFFITKYKRCSTGHRYLHRNGDWLGLTGTESSPTGRYWTLAEAEDTAKSFGYEPVID